jgi:hypothetical protein
MKERISKQTSKLIDDTVDKLHHLPNRTIAWYLFYNHGALFDGDLEKIRAAVRYRMGAMGEEKRHNATFKRSKPAELPPTRRIKRTRYNLAAGKHLVYADPHVPFHEIKPIEAMAQYAADRKVTGKVLLGDGMDCDAMSFWVTSNKRDFDAETLAFIDFLDWMNKNIPTKDNVYLPANHEYRLRRRFHTSIPELAGLPMAIMENSLGLEERGIELLDYHQTVMAGKLPMIHGDEFRRLDRSVNPARGLFLRAKSWALCAHCHTTSQHLGKNINDELLTTWSIGCMCDLHPDYMVLGNDWNHGFAIVEVDKNGDFEVENKRILPSGKVV